MPAEPDTSAVWPPPPSGMSTPSELTTLRVGHLRLAWDNQRLSIRNLTARMVIVMECMMLGLNLLSPFWIVALLPIPPEHTYLQTVWRAYHIRGVLLMVMFVVVFGAYLGYFYERVLYRGWIVIDWVAGNVRRGGEVYCLTRDVQAVRVRRVSTVFGVTYFTLLVREGDNTWPPWQKLLRYPLEPNTARIGACRREAQALQVAQAVAEFAGVPVERV